jgi:hypothetical protein
MQRDPIDFVLTRRVLEFVDPWWTLAALRGEVFAHPTRAQIETAPIQPFQPEEQRNEKYDLGRVRFFVEVLRRGQDLPPVVMDNRCLGRSILPEAILTDGHHRLAAAAHDGLEWLPAYYSGRVDVLEWLQGAATRPLA